MKTMRYEYLVHATNDYFDDPNELIRLVAYGENEAAARASLKWELWELEERCYEIQSIRVLHEEEI